MNARREAGRRLVVSRRNRPERLDLAEDILNPVPVPIGVSVKGARKRSVFLRRNHRLRSAFGEPIQQGVRVTGRVADQCHEGNVLKKVGHRHPIMARTGEDDKTNQRPDRVRQCDALAGQTASSVRCLSMSPFFRPGSLGMGLQDRPVHRYDRSIECVG